jgi:hypothetical protein
MGFGRGILLWLLGIPLPIIIPARAPLAMRRLESRRWARNSRAQRKWLLGTAAHS